MTFLIFDPQNDLIFMNLEPSFEEFLINSDLISIYTSDEHSNLNNKNNKNSLNPESIHKENNQNNYEELDSETAIKFSMTLLLAPFISTKRQMDEDIHCEMNSVSHAEVDENLKIHFDSIPNTLIVYKNCHQFMFIHLCQKLTKMPFNNLNDIKNPLSSAYLQRKITIFAQLTFFVFGNSLYNMSKHSRELKLLLELVNKWQELNNDFVFLLECLESLSLGTHLQQLISSNMNHVEQLIRLHTQALMNERWTGLLLLFHDKLIFKHLSHNMILRQEDILSLFLLSQLEIPLSDSVTESDEYRNPNYYENGQLIFLKSHSLSILVPHIYRKLLITDELYLLIITEVTSPVSSILLLSLSTMIQSFSSLKSDLNDHLSFSPRKWAESLKRIVENFQRFIKRNFEQSLFLSQQFNIGSMSQLAELTKNINNFESNTLAREQIDRILTITIRTLYYYYEKLAFNQLHCELLPECLKSFTFAQRQINIYLKSTFDNSIDYIRVKYGTERVSLGTIIYQNYDLVSFLLIDRKECSFIFGHLPEFSSKSILDKICDVYLRLLSMRIHSKTHLVLDDQKLRCIYLQNSLLQKPTTTSSQPKSTCELSRILSQKSNILSSIETSLLTNTSSTERNQSSHSQSQYEMFFITKIQTFTNISSIIADNNKCHDLDDLSLSVQFNTTIVEPCEPSFKEILNLARNVLQFIKNY